MERVAFLLEDSGERLGCLLNPESVVMKRRAGVRPRQTSGNLVSGANMMDDSLLYTGGGDTWLELELLFDVTLAGSSIDSDDVRDLTLPLWQLAENAQRDEGYGRPPLCRFVWGKSWNIPGIVTAVAERLEYFTAEGSPRRSWLRLRFVRVVEPKAGEQPVAAAAGSAQWMQKILPGVGGEVEVHEIIGGGVESEDGTEVTGERLDQLAYDYFGDPNRWRDIAEFNNIDNPLAIAPGMHLEIPFLATLQAGLEL